MHGKPIEIAELTAPAAEDQRDFDRRRHHFEPSSASTVTPEVLRILKQKPLSVAPGVVDAASDHNPLEIRAGRRSPLS
jgi:hypothetical protein